jgi:hypothetical protein
VKITDAIRSTNEILELEQFRALSQLDRDTLVELQISPSEAKALEVSALYMMRTYEDESGPCPNSRTFSCTLGALLGALLAGIRYARSPTTQYPLGRESVELEAEDAGGEELFEWLLHRTEELR